MSDLSIINMIFALATFGGLGAAFLVAPLMTTRNRRGSFAYFLADNPHYALISAFFTVCAVVGASATLVIKFIL